MKKAIVSVINDLVTDQRVNRNCLALEKAGYSVTLIGRQKKDNLELINRSYQMHRMRLFFEKGPFFYAEYNIRLFCYLLFHPTDLYFSNDLDTLLPNLILSKINGQKLIFDSHEYFTETPELTDRLVIQKIWKTIERFSIPFVKTLITVNESIANLFKSKYGLDFTIIRNIPSGVKSNDFKTRKDLGLPENKKIILLQGAGINKDRGSEELVEAMQYVDKNHLLLIIGAGDVIDFLKERTIELKLYDQVQFIPKQALENLINYTRNADLGLSIDKDTNLNYKYSLPNKIFDYIHAGVPILCSRLIEIEKIVNQYQIGDFIENHHPKHIAEKINSILDDNDQLERWKVNTKIAADELNWEQEEQKLISLIHDAK